MDLRHRTRARGSVAGRVHPHGQRIERGRVRREDPSGDAGGGDPAHGRRVRRRTHPGRLVRLLVDPHPRAVRRRPVHRLAPTRAAFDRMVVRRRRSLLPRGHAVRAVPRRFLLLPDGRTVRGSFDAARIPIMTTDVAPVTVPIKFRGKGKGSRAMTPGRRVFNAINAIVLTAFALICVLPFVNVLASSLATPGEIATTPFILFPKTFTLEAYRYILSTPTIFRAMGVSAFVTIVGTFVSLVLTAFMAYALSKKHLKGRRAINFLVVFTMLFSGGMIPTFMVVNAFGLIDSLWSLILPVAI